MGTRPKCLRTLGALSILANRGAIGCQVCDVQPEAITMPLNPETSVSQGLGRTIRVLHKHYEHLIMRVSASDL